MRNTASNVEIGKLQRAKQYLARIARDENGDYTDENYDAIGLITDCQQQIEAEIETELEAGA